MKLRQFVRWCVSDRNGRVVFGQRPNLPIMAGTLAAILSVVTPGYLRIALSLIAFGSLFTWAWLEIFMGTTPLRRFVGGLFMAVLLVLSVLLIRAVRLRI